jgi:ABC-2 type transport system permease protein
MAVAFRGGSDNLLNILWDPGARLLGGQTTQSLSSAFEETPTTIPVQLVLRELATQFTQPDLWIGLVLAAGFIYAASEIRRRRAL